MLWENCIFCVIYLIVLVHIQALTSDNVDVHRFEAIENRHCIGVEPRLKENSSCLCLHATLDRFTNKTLQEFLLNVETMNVTIRQAKIAFHLPPTSTEMLHIGEHLDKFLESNMWWSVSAEPFSWHVNSKEGIILERYHAGYEPYLRLLSAIQYPDSQTCSKTPLLVIRSGMVHPGWGSVVEYHHKTHLRLPYVPTVVYASRSNNPADPNERTAYMSANECNTTNNKWDCAFLPETNCTIPDLLTKCNTINCVFQYPDSAYIGLLMSVADASGKPISQNDVDTVLSSLYKHTFNKPYSAQLKALSKHSHSTSPPGYSQAPIYNSTFRVTSPGQSSSLTSTYWFRFMLRSNYRFRSLIAEQIHHFYHKNRIHSSTRCVTAQVRRGDRVIKGVDMIEFCKNATGPITSEHPINYCRDAMGHLQRCDSGIGLDKGCSSPVPFGAVTLDMIIKSAEQLVEPAVKTIFVFTDDEPWLDAERARVQHKYPAWKIVNLEAPKADAPWGTAYDQKFNQENYAEGYTYMRSQGGSKSGSFFLASLQLAQQCEAFIGHHDSAATGMFKASMCYKSKNGLQQGICPPVYDLRTGKVAV